MTRMLIICVMLVSGCMDSEPDDTAGAAIVTNPCGGVGTQTLSSETIEERFIPDLIGSPTWVYDPTVTSPVFVPAWRQTGNIAQSANISIPFTPGDTFLWLSMASTANEDSQATYVVRRIPSYSSSDGLQNLIVKPDNHRPVGTWGGVLLEMVLFGTPPVMGEGDALWLNLNATAGYAISEMTATFSRPVVVGGSGCSS